MANRSTYHCISCSGIVTLRMHAVCCDVCSRWQHRKCKTGISSEQYRLMVKGDLELEWNCEECRVSENANSTAVIDALLPTLDVSAIASPVRNLSTTYVVRQDEEMTIEDADTGMNDVSFNISNRDFIRPVRPEDPPLVKLVDVEIPEDVPLSFHVVESGSKRGGRKLVSSDGFTYTVRREKCGRTYWSCSIRGKNMTCYAGVKQFGDMFTRNGTGHIHPSDPGAMKKVVISSKVKEIARENVFRPAAQIVENVMAEMTTREDVCLPKPINLKRAANHLRKKLRPSHPIILDFEVGT